MPVYTTTEENYLKTIYKLSSNIQDRISTNAISDSLNTTPASVSDMLRKLADKKLLIYEKYYGVKLTRTGEQVAKALVRRHRLWEVFLVEKLHFQWDEVHDFAEQLEHVHGEELISRLEKFLGNPKFDPHGDPIPDEKGNMMVRRQTCLSELDEGDKGVVVGVKDTSAVFLKYLDSMQISLASSMKVIERISYDQSVRVKMQNGRELMLSRQVCENLYVG